MAQDVRWQDIVHKISKVYGKGKRKKQVRDTVLIFYASFESNIVPGCNITIKGIGRFKGGKKRLQTEALIKRSTLTRDRFYRKWDKRKQRLWAKEKFDDNWDD